MFNLQKNKKVIGLVLPYLKSRGTDKQALRLTKGFTEKNIQVVLFVIQGWGLEKMYRDFNDAGANVVNVGKPEKKGQKALDLSRVFSLAFLARKHGCDVLMSRAWRSNRICGLAGLIAFIPTISVLSGPVLPEEITPSFFGRLMAFVRMGKNYGFPARVVSVSGESAVNFARSFPFFSKHVMAIPNGVEVSEEEKRADSPIQLNMENFNICFSGSLELRRKGLDSLLAAIRHLVSDRGLNHIRLILIGAGEDEAKLKNLAGEYGLAHHVMFAGEQSNPFPIIKRCDVFVLPSRQEGMPNALLEAMALGICCISTDCDTGPREIIENGKNGILVPVGDSNALAEAVFRLEQDPGLRDKLAQNGQKTVAERFSYKRMVDAYYDMIREII